MAKPAQSLAVKQPVPSPDRTEHQRAADLDRHTRKCAVCNHAQRDDIEDDFLQWDEPVAIVDEYELPSRSSLFRHAKATGLLARRNQNLRGVAERIMEFVSSSDVSGNTVLRAMRIYASITEDGQWREPAKRSVVTHIHKFEQRDIQTDASLSRIAPEPQLAQAENKALTIPLDEILIGTPKSSRGESSD